MPTPTLRPQEVRLDAPCSSNMFEPTSEKPFVYTPGAFNTFGIQVIVHCLRELQEKARREGGLDYLQVFDVDGHDEPLWFIEDGEGGAITALLPSEY